MICVASDAEALAAAAAERFAAEAGRATAARGRFLVLLAGGETPRRLYRLLAEEPWRSSIPWHRTFFFWGDERCVPPEDPRSNRRMVTDTLLDRLTLSPDQRYPIPCDLPPQLAAEAYQDELLRFFGTDPPRFDLVLLGLGEDGHTASLFPGSDALKERHRWTAVTRRPEEPFDRITLTAPVLSRGRLIMFLVSGAAKARIVAQLLENEGTPFPARLIVPAEGELLWLLDREAAALLKGPIAAVSGDELC